MMKMQNIFLSQDNIKFVMTRNAECKIVMKNVIHFETHEYNG